MEKFLHPVELKNVSYERNKIRFQKKLKGLIGLLIFLAVYTFSTNNVNAQTTPLPKDHPVKVAAPNLPEMVRASASEENVFHGLGNSYSKANEATVKAWIAKYPTELESYKTAISIFIKEAESKTLTDSEKDTFSDLKSQYFMIIQLAN